MTKYAFSVNSDSSLDALVIPDSILVIPDIDVSSLPTRKLELLVEHYDIQRSPLALDKARLSIATMFHEEGVAFSEARIQFLSDSLAFTEQEKAIIDQVVNKLLDRPISLHDFRNERIAYYVNLGVSAQIAETYLEMQTRPHSEWHEGDWAISNQVGTLIHAAWERNERRQKEEAREKALTTISEQIESFLLDPTSEQQNRSLLRIASACIYSQGAFPTFPLSNDDMPLITEGQDSILSRDQIYSIMTWLAAEQHWLNVPAPLEPMAPRSPFPLIEDIDDGGEDEEPEEDRIEWREAEALEMTDTEYAALLAEGVNPITEERLWELDDIRADLSRFITKLCMKEGIARGADEFTKLLKQTATSIAEDAFLLPPHRIEEIVLGYRFEKLTAEELTKVDTWVETHFGAKLSQFPDIIRQGINPATLEILET